MDDPNTTEARFETYYAPGLGTKYAVRSWVVSAVILAVGVPVTWFTFVGNPQWWVLVLVGLAFAFVLFLTISSAVGSLARWGSDGGLAIAIDEAGITLPRLGRIAWDDIHAIRVMDAGFVTADVWLRAWERWTGSSTNRFMTFWVNNGEAIVERTGGAADSMRNLHPLDGRVGFDGVWGDGLDARVWETAVAVLRDAARSHGVTLLGQADTPAAAPPTAGTPAAAPPSAPAPPAAPPPRAAPGPDLRKDSLVIVTDADLPAMLPARDWKPLIQGATERYVAALDLAGARLPPMITAVVQIRDGFSLSRIEGRDHLDVTIPALGAYGETRRAGRAVAPFAVFPWATHRFPEPSTWSLAVFTAWYFAHEFDDPETRELIAPLVDVIVARDPRPGLLRAHLLRNPLDAPEDDSSSNTPRRRAERYLRQIRWLATFWSYGGLETMPRNVIEAEVDRYRSALFALPGGEPLA